MKKFQYGSVVYPIPAGAAGASLLGQADPALRKIMDFLQFMINGHIDEALVEAAGATDAPITSAIQQVAPVDPNTIAKQEQWQFPLFCGWRKSSKYSERTLNWPQDVTSVGLAYILPPLTAAQLVRFQPILTAVGHVVNYALSQGFDPDYKDGERIISANDIAKIRLISADFGAFKFAKTEGAPLFPAWVADVELTEQSMPYTVGLPLLTGADFVVVDKKSTDVGTDSIPEVDMASEKGP